MAKLNEIEDLGEQQLAALETLGLRTTDDLLAAGAAPAGRQALARELGVDEPEVLRWVNHADLQRVKGVGEEYADLLEEAGVDTVPELARRNAANLTGRLAEVNAERGLVERVPTEAQVAGWIEQAKGLPRVIVYRDAPGGAIETPIGTAGPATPTDDAALEPSAGDAPAAPEGVAELVSATAAVADVPMDAASGLEAAAAVADVPVEAGSVLGSAAATVEGAPTDGVGAAAELAAEAALPIADPVAPAPVEPVVADRGSTGVALPLASEERGPRVGLTLDPSPELPLLRAQEERDARGWLRRTIDRVFRT